MFEITQSGIAIFGLELRWYGILIALGVFLAVLLAMRREKKLSLPKDTALNIALIGVPVGIVCARIYYVVFSWQDYAGSLADIVNIRQGGLAIYGGVIGGVLSGAIYSAVKKVKLSSIADLAAPSLALGQAIGRWGNFFNQEAYGAAISNPRMQFFPLGVMIDGSGWHYATFFYESVWCALIVCLLLAGEKKRLFKRNGDIFLSYLLLYAAERSFVEGLRTDSLYLGPLRVSQMLSVIVVIAVACVFALRSRSILGWLSVLAAVLTCAAAAFHSSLLTAVFALTAVALTAALHISQKNKTHSKPA